MIHVPKHRAGLLTPLPLKAMLIWDFLTRRSAPTWVTENADDLFLRKTLKRRTVAHLSENFSGQSPVGSLKDKWTDVKGPLVRSHWLMGTGWTGREEFEVSFRLWLKGREPLYGRLRVCLFFFFPVFVLYLVILCISIARQTKSRNLLRHSLPIAITLQSAIYWGSIFEGSNQIK